MIDNHEDSNAEIYRRQLLTLADKVAMLESTVHELQGQVQQGYIRIQELVNERDQERHRNDQFLKIYQE